MILSGLDEAALGPSLGPFCACLVSFEYSSGVQTTETDPELYNLLASIVSNNKNENNKITVADSKVLYSRSTGIELLERGVTGFLAEAGLNLPCSLSDLLDTLCNSEDSSALSEPLWYKDAGNFRIPWSEGVNRSSGGQIPEIPLKDFGLKLELPRLRFVSARSFNRRLETAGGKGNAVRSIISPLLRYGLIGAADGDYRRLTVDRQGGRRYYGEWLTELLPGAPLRALEEGPRRSAYRTGNCHVEFLVGADGIRLETALASMIAKYVRESAMKLFNSWWAEKVPGIRPTAGYPQDAKRFIADLDVAGAIGEHRDSLVRRM